MKVKVVSLVIAAILALQPRFGDAGGTAPCLTSASKPCDDVQSLGDIPFKAAVLQFVDPQQTDAGLAVSRLLWRELLFSIIDMKGRGVIHSSEFASDFSQRYGKSPTNYLDEGLHSAAVDIARRQKVLMSMWGAVVSDGDVLTVYSFLTLIPEAWKESLGLSLAVGKKASSVSEPLPLIAPLSQTDFNFDPIVTTRGKLFGGVFRLRCALSEGCPKGIPAYAAPQDSAPIIHYFRAGEVVTVRNMIGKWMELKFDDGSREYINIYHVDIAPPEIFVRSATLLRSTPGARGQLDTVPPASAYSVLAIDWTGPEKNRRRWFRIRMPTKEGWVSGDTIEPLYRFSATHFLAGLFRYGGGEFERAEREFTHFLQALTPKSDNSLRSATLQLIAACRAQVRLPNASEEKAAATAALTEAAKFTPFDPAIFNMRALISLSAARRLSAALPDLRHSVQLDTGNPGTKELLERLAPKALASFGISSDKESGSELTAIRAQALPSKAHSTP